MRLHAAGWKVCCLPDEAGSLEGNPPALPEFLARDLRWAAGNMQYGALLLLPGTDAGWGAGSWCRPSCCSSARRSGSACWRRRRSNAATGGGAATPGGALLALMLATWAALHAPKLLGYAEALLKPALAARYGGRAAFLRGAAAEIASPRCSTR